MKVAATLLLLALVSMFSAPLAAQPDVSYIIPDVIAPGMNVHVEIVARHGSKNTFGADGFSLNNPTDLIRVELANPADAATIAIGPVVVSWEGRLITTQIFVNPTRVVAAATPIGLRVIVNNGPPALVSVSLQNPQRLGANGVVSGNNVFGGGLGSLSPRGVIIVDSLFLNAGIYTSAASNLFPLTILSKGPIEVRSGARIEVNGGNRNAGPGGGGGGGRSCDQIEGNAQITSGGSGYTAGSSGAQNVGNRRRDPTVGASTGPPGSGNSLNGALGGINNVCYEGATGGTGHPFGRGSQNIWCGNTFPDQDGEFGGASVSIQRSGGGGGGYRTDGGNGGLSSLNRGRVHGNIYGVPVAGGSGGASGNPQASLGNGCAGFGGGGGGALVIYSMSRFQNLNGGFLNAIGANGEDESGGNASGGAGSGGAIILGGKVLQSTGGTGSVAGGVGGQRANRGGNGGNGMVRGDGTITPPSMSGTGSIFLGPSIDTLTYTDSSVVVLNGTVGSVGNVSYTQSEFQIYMKSDAPGSLWRSVGALTGAGRIWRHTVTVTASGTYYFVIVQDVRVSGGGQGNEYNRRPDFIMSQAGANIVKVDLIPKMNAIRDNNSILDFGPVTCANVDFDTIKVFNTGDAPLLVTPTLSGPNAGDFQIINPAQRTIAPGAGPADTALIVIRFAPTATGARTATLTLTNNDPRPGKNPYTYTLNGRKSLIQGSFSGTNRVDFGPNCKGATPPDRTIDLAYSGDVNTTFRIVPLGAHTTGGIFAVVSPTGSTPLTVGGAPSRITLRFRPAANVVRAYADSFRVYIGDCDSLTIFVNGSVVEAAATLTPDPLGFGNARVNIPVTLPFTVTNTGASPIRIRNVSITPAGPFTLGAPSLVGTTVAPGATATGNVTFTPTASGDFTARLCVDIEDAVNSLCPAQLCVDVTGKGVTSLLVLSDKTLLFEADTCADPAPAVTRTFRLYNRGVVSERITGVTSGPRVTVTSAPTLPTDLAAGDSITFTVTWIPGLAGIPLTEQVVITTTSPEPTQQRMVVDLTLIRERSLLDLLDAAGTPLASDSLVTFPYVFDCNVPQTREIVIRNAGTIPTRYSARLIKGAPFSITPATGSAIATGADQRITVTFAPPAVGEYDDVLEILSEGCGVVMRVNLKGGRYALNFTTTGATFGPSNVGVTRTGTVSIAFDSTTPNDVRARIVAITKGPGTGPEFTISPPPLPVDLAPKEALTVPVDFTPTAEQAYSGTVCFQISGPCPQTICVDISGTGIRSNILVRPSSLDFGTLYVCQTGEQEFDIENTGSAPLRLENLVLSGPDAGAFAILEPLPATLPATIPGPGTLRIRVRFDPALAGTDGLKTATLTITSDDPTQGLIALALIAERRQQVLATPIALDFGRVEVGQTIERTVTLENRTADPLTLDRLTLPAPFVIIDPIIPPDRIIPVGGSIVVRVSFTPVDTLPAIQNMLASQASPCTDVTSIPVRGQGKITAQGAVTVAIPDSLRGRPGQRLAIPFVLERSRVLAETGATTFRATVRFDRTMLFATGARSRNGASLKPVTGAAVSGGRIVSNTIEGDERVVTVEITNDPMLTAPDTLGFLDVTVALGEALTSPVRFDTLFFTDADAPVAVTTDDGLFTLEGYCVVGGNRLVEVGGSAKISSITPNPVTAATEILFETNEDGPTTLAIFDASGSLVETLVDNSQLPVQAHLIVWNAGRLASGVYYVVLQTPTERITQRMVVIK